VPWSLTHGSTRIAGSAALERSSFFEKLPGALSRGEPTSPHYFMVRGKTTTLCRSRDEPGGVKAQRRTASMPSLVLGSALAFFPRHSLQQLSLQGRSKAQAHCLRSGGLVPRSLSRVH